MFDINNDTDKPQSRFINKIFKEGVNYAYPDGKNETKWIFLPAHVLAPAAIDPDTVDPLKYEHPDAIDPSAYVPYRTPDFRFSFWVGGYYGYDFFGPNRDHQLISPRSFKADAFDPMAALFEACKSNPAWCHLAGLGTDGKRDQKNPDAFKEAILGRPDELRVVNAIPFDGEDAGKPKVLVVKKTVMGTPQDDKWGLLSKLQRKLPPRSQGSVVNNQWTNLFMYGDPTDPNGPMAVRIFKETPASKGNAIYNGALVIDKTTEEPAIYEALSAEDLAGRRYLGNIFQQPESAELIQTMITLFAPAHPQLVKKAFMNHVPNINKLLGDMGVTDGDTVRQVGGRRDEAPQETDGEDAPAGVPARTFTDRQSASAAAGSSAANPAPAPSRFTPRPTAAPVAGVTNSAPAAPTQPAARPAAFAPRPTPAAAQSGSSGGIAVAAVPRSTGEINAGTQDILAQLDEAAEQAN